MEVSLSPSLSLPTPQEVLCCEFSPFEWSQELVALATATQLHVYQLNLDEETISHKHLWCCDLEAESSAIGWSCHTDVNATPPHLALLLAGADHAINLLATDLVTSSLSEMVQHVATVNSVACNASGVCGSAADDQCVRVWRVAEGGREPEWQTSVMLAHPGQSIKFHPEDPDLLLVGEITGTVRIYRINHSQDGSVAPVLTADWSARVPSPMLDADWCLQDAALLATAGPGGVTLLAFDPATRGVTPSHRAVSAANAGSVRVAISRHSSRLVATLSADCCLTVMQHATNTVPLTARLPAASGLSWHLTRPLVAVGCDRKLLLWRLNRV